MSNYYFGCSGWYYWHWQELFYEGIPQNKWFGYYAKKFNSVELNSTFYHFPKLSTAKSWYRKAPKNFMYSIKANKLITHIKKFKGTKAIVKEFYKVVSELKEKLGCILFQIPPNLHYNEKKLKEIVNQINPEYKNVFEFRHDSWWNEKVYEELKENNIIFCIVSAEKLPEEFIKTSNDIYIRFHGKQWYNYDYTTEELKKYASEIRKAKAKNVWAYFNNDYNAYAPKNCLELKGLLKG